MTKHQAFLKDLEEKKAREFWIVKIFSKAKDPTYAVSETKIPWSSVGLGNERTHAIEYSAYHDLCEKLKWAVEALEKSKYLIVEDECDECGTFSGIKYEVKPIHETLARIYGETGKE